MRYLLFLLVIIVVGSPLYSAETITVKTMTGKVEIKEPGEIWSKAFEGREIPAGSVISTGFKSQAELDLSGSSTIFVKPLTRISVDKLAISGKKVNTRLNLKLGRIKADVKTSTGLRHDFTLRTPVSTAAVRGTVFESSVRKLQVVTGRVNFGNKIGQFITVDGGSTSIMPGFGYETPIPPVVTAETDASTPPPDISGPTPPPTTGTVILTWDISVPPPPIE